MLKESDLHPINPKTPAAQYKPSLITFAFRSSEVRQLLLDLYPYGGTDLFGMFSFFWRELIQSDASITATFLLVKWLGWQ